MGKGSGACSRQPLEMTDEEVLEVKLENVLELASKVASQLHGIWQENLKLVNGKFEPRLKIVQDKAWISKHDGLQRVDIANSNYIDLPREWQRENFLAAKSAVLIIAKQLCENGLIDFEKAAALVHQEWLERNGTQARESQKLAYNQLTESEKDKDRRVVQAVIDNLG
jgi:hypothetical protein